MFDNNKGNKQKMKATKIKLEIDDELSGGKYVNIAMVNHSDAEFTIDGFFIQPQKPVAKHAMRMITSPLAAKRLYMLLGARLSKFEKMFGEIKLPQAPIHESDEIN